MRGLFYDTETTGLPLFDMPSEDPRQPHIVQIGAALVDLESRRRLATIDLTIQPDGWVIPDDVAAVHGITTSHAEAIGVPESMALDLLLELQGRADVRIAHNEPFDARIVRIAIERLLGNDDGLADDWNGRASFCTARAATPIMALPPTARMRAVGRHHHKTPKLSEAYKFYTGRDLDGAHNAMVDVDACIEVYFAMGGSNA